jgi:hypothetical protein
MVQKILKYEGKYHFRVNGKQEKYRKLLFIRVNQKD